MKGMKEAFEAWCLVAPLAPMPKVPDAFKAGWEAAMKEMTSTNPRVEDGPIFSGTMQGVANYLERLDRNAFATLRRAYEADGWTTKTAQRYAIEYLQIEWCNVGDAWRIAQKLVD